MKIPLSWLKEFVEVTVEPRRLADDLTMVGLAVDGIETHGAETVLDLDITTNRVDAMNVYGVAREVSVLYGLPLRPPDTTLAEAGAPASQVLSVEIEAPDLCPRFCARVLDVRIAPSPAWLRDRLELVGVRPINNVVDLSNYAMMEMGHPSHAFDLARIPDHRIVVRWARAGETLRTLDGVDRALGPRLGVVAGPREPLALAGIMGGAASEVTDDTRVVALEAAWWDPLSIRRGAKALGMRTEASHRFERGADPEMPPAATARFAHLLAKIGAGGARPGLIDVHPAPRPRRAVSLRPARARALLGAPVADEAMEATLRGLGFAVERTGDALATTVPPWRGDVAREADLVEEVGRHYRLDRIPATVPAARRAEGLRPAQSRERVARQALAGLGLTEVLNYAFVPEAVPGRPSGEAPPRLANPLSAEQAVLRTSLVVPGLLSALRANARQGRHDARLFEVGRVFQAEAGGDVREERRLALVLCGAAEAHWSARAGAPDFYEVAGLLETLAARLGHEALELTEAAPLGHLHPGQSARVRLAGEAIGHVGALHPGVAEAWELRGPVFVAEVGLDPLVAPAEAVRARAIPRFPSVERDLSLLWDEGAPSALLVETARGSAGPLLREAVITDRYQGPPVPEGKVSLKLSLRFQDAERTLTGDDVQATVARVVEALARSGAVIRGE
jgi:phenylalanyl-tRNA synthetase beta chain